MTYIENAADKGGSSGKVYQRDLSAPGAAELNGALRAFAIKGATAETKSVGPEKLAATRILLALESRHPHRLDNITLCYQILERLESKEAYTLVAKELANKYDRLDNYAKLRNEGVGGAEVGDNPDDGFKEYALRLRAVAGLGSVSDLLKLIAQKYQSDENRTWLAQHVLDLPFRYASLAAIDICAARLFKALQKDIESFKAELPAGKDAENRGPDLLDLLGRRIMHDTIEAITLERILEKYREITERLEGAEARGVLIAAKMNPMQVAGDLTAVVVNYGDRDFDPKVTLTTLKWLLAQLNEIKEEYGVVLFARCVEWLRAKGRLGDIRQYWEALDGVMGRAHEEDRRLRHGQPDANQQLTEGTFKKEIFHVENYYPKIYDDLTAASRQ